MYRNIFLVGGWTIASRLTGFLRDMALAALMGGGALNDAYIAAIKLPNQFRQIFGEGSFNAAYLPTYTRVLEAGGPEKASQFASQVFTLLILSQIALLGLVYLDMPLLVRLTSPGFVSEPDKFAQAVAMSRIMFPYIAFIAVFALHQGTLNANNAWGAPAFAPVAANICMIAFLAFAAFFPKVSPGVASMASWGFLASGAAQLVIVAAAARRRGLLERLTWPRWTPEVRRFLWMLGPAIGISASYQIGALADQIVGSLLPTGGLSAISYADRLYQLPGGVIVIATGSVLLREMSALVALGDDRGAVAAQNRAASLTIALGAPFIVAFLLIPDLIVAVAFEHGAFKANATQQAAGVLAAYAVGMPALLVDRNRHGELLVARRHSDASQGHARRRCSQCGPQGRAVSALGRAGFGARDCGGALDQSGWRLCARSPSRLDSPQRGAACDRRGGPLRGRRACACVDYSRRTAPDARGASPSPRPRGETCGANRDRDIGLFWSPGPWTLAHRRDAGGSSQAGAGRAPAGKMN